MTTFLKNLAEMLVNPDGGVQPRLPGRFEPPHPAGMGLFDFEPADEMESAPYGESRRAEPPAPAEPPHPSGELSAPSESALSQMERQPDQPEPVPITSPLEIVSEPPASQGQLQRTATPGPVVEPVVPTVFREVSPTIQPTLERSAPETVKRSPPPAKVEPFFSVPQPDFSEAPTDGGPLSPAEKPQPGPVLSEEGQPVRSEERKPARSEERQPFRPHPHAAPVIPVEVRLTPVTEPATPTQPAPPPATPLAQRTRPRPAVSEESQPQIEPAAPPAKTEPAPAPAAPETIGEPVLVRREGRPPMEPLFMEPLVPLPFHQERPDQGPTLRGPDQGPTIRVTIGRVEVRAALPPAPPQRAQPVRRRPALPLDQYLKRRSEGKG